MRKMFKKKRRACALCKGNKRGAWQRWRRRDYYELKRFDRARRSGHHEDL